MRPAERLAPAKINLGLEVIGKRPDGFHEIRTIMQATSLFDRIAVSPADAFTFTCDRPDLEAKDNLVPRAVSLLEREMGRKFPVHIHLEKRIPAAAGLGGASSDAAATLQLLDEVFDLDVAPDRLAALALELGSDVPFFLRGGTQLAGGRGERLESLASLAPCTIVIVTPRIEIPRKTASLYGALTPDDFSGGMRVGLAAGEIGAGRLPDPDLLANAFSTPLSRVAPAIDRVGEAMGEAGAPFVALSGAGPSHYTWHESAGQAAGVADRLRASLGDWAEVFTVVPSPPMDA